MSEVMCGAENMIHGDIKTNTCTDVILIDTSTSYTYKLLEPTTCIPEQVVGFNNLQHPWCHKLLDPTTCIPKPVSYTHPEPTRPY